MSVTKVNNIYLIVNGNLFLSSELGNIIFFQEEAIQSLPMDEFERHHFYTDSNNHYFVMETKTETASVPFKNLGHDWRSLRSQLGKISDSEFQLIGRAQQILRWYKEHQYCGACGAKTVRQSADFVIVCSACRLEFYPKIAPCIIVLVTRGAKCLLAHHTRATTPRFSCLAGFIEAGETPEQTLVREVMEEVGIKVHNLHYCASQAWPFPGQLMLGYTAEYLSGELLLQADEIQNAEWFGVDELPEIPPKGTIARQLIDHFFYQGQ